MAPWRPTKGQKTVQLLIIKSVSDVIPYFDIKNDHSDIGAIKRYEHCCQGGVGSQVGYAIHDEDSARVKQVMSGKMTIVRSTISLF